MDGRYLDTVISHVPLHISRLTDVIIYLLDLKVGLQHLGETKWLYKTLYKKSKTLITLKKKTLKQ